MVLPIAPAAPLVATAPSASAGPQRSFAAALRAHAPPSTAAPERAGAPGRVALESIDRARRSLDAAVAAARRGQTFTAHELLALQAQAYRYTQVVEVASKVVEQGVQALKQAVNTQV